MVRAIRISPESYEQLDEALWDVGVYIHRAMEKLKKSNAILQSLVKKRSKRRSGRDVSG